MDSKSQPFEEQLAQALRENAELRKGLEESERALAASQAAADELQRFFYAATHDLRQPLRTIACYAQLLQKQYALDESTSELTAFIAGSAHEMNTLIDDLLKYSRTGESLRRSMVNLASVVQWAMMNLQTAIRECGAQIVYEDLPELPIDESLFVQVFQHLFSNALKFRSAETPRIEITAQEEAQACTISVRDNGQGIEPRFQEQVFQPFKRLHGKQIPGSGLGLALCRKIIEVHGGKIRIESDGEHGSVFRFTVPF